jgi:DNA-binding XRE family transcriptional regulator
MQPDDANAHKISQAIRRLRKRLRLTQAELGRRLLVWTNTVSRYEIGTVCPSLQVLFILWELAEGGDEQSTFYDALTARGFDPHSFGEPLNAVQHGDTAQLRSGDV